MRGYTVLVWQKVYDPDRSPAPYISENCKTIKLSSHKMGDKNCSHLILAIMETNNVGADFLSQC